MILSKVLDGRRSLRDRNQFPWLLDALGYRTGAEIGVLRGAFSVRLLKDSSVERLYGIDPWRNTSGRFMQEDHDKAVANLAEFGGRSGIIVDSSPEASARFKDGELDFVYIDANHSYDCARADIAAWAPKVRAGGMLSGHDYVKSVGALPRGYYTGRPQVSDGVMRAVDEHVAATGHSLRVTLGRDPSWWFIKKES